MEADTEAQGFLTSWWLGSKAEFPEGPNNGSWPFQSLRKPVKHMATMTHGDEWFKHPWSSPTWVFAGWAGVEVINLFISSEQNILSLKSLKPLPSSAKWE